MQPSVKMCNTNDFMCHWCIHTHTLTHFNFFSFLSCLQGVKTGHNTFQCSARFQTIHKSFARWNGTGWFYIKLLWSCLPLGKSLEFFIFTIREIFVDNFFSLINDDCSFDDAYALRNLLFKSIPCPICDVCDEIEWIVKRQVGGGGSNRKC